MDQPPEARRHADGSIDTGYYAGLGRALHGRAVRGAVFRLAAGAGRLMAAGAARLRLARRRAGRVREATPAE